MIIKLMVDPLGTAHQTQEEEYDELEKKIIPNWLPGYKNLKFDREILPHELKQIPTDLYVFDFGGIMPGCDSMIMSQIRDLIEMAEEKLNTLFVIYSTFSYQWYMDLIADEFPELKLVNVIAHDRDFEKNFEAWFPPKERQEPKPKLVTPVRGLIKP